MQARTLERHGRALAAAAITVLTLLTLLAIALFAGPAAAGGPGAWTDISGNVGSSLVQPSAARVAGGPLHVLWTVDGTPEYLKYRQIGADGTASAATLDLAPGGWPTLSLRPSIVTDSTGNGLLAFAGGISPGTSPAYDGLVSWVSTDAGASFLPTPALVTADGQAYGSDPAAVVTGGGVFQTWSGTLGVWTHQGETPSPSAVNVNDVGNYGYNSNFAYDATGRLFVVAEYNATGKEGLWARQFDPVSGAATGASFELANSWTSYSGTRSFDLEDTRTPVVGLQAGQAVVIVAYPTGYPSSSTLRVWRLTPSGQSNVALVKGGKAKSATAVAADPNGRAWVVWTQNDGTARRTVYASRSNVGATAWGPVVSLKGPAGTDTLWQLAASAQSDRLDVLAQYGQGSEYHIYHTQLLAGLGVSFAPAKVKAGKAVKVSVTVTDAGVAVPGASVTIGGAKGTTNAAGVAKVKVKASKAGQLKVTVSKAGYAVAKASLKVKK